MKILIDADGCPVVDIVIRIAQQHGIETLILCDTAHVFQKPGATTLTVDKGTDSVDFKLVNLVTPGDIVITQDYGLAAMCMAKGALPIHQDGIIYHEGNINSLLQSRYAAKKIRKAGGRLKGPPKRKPEQNEAFAKALDALIQHLSLKG